MDLEMDPLLFGLVTDPSDTIWASNAKPTFNGDKLVYSAPLGGPDMTVTTINNEKKLLTKLWFALTGNNRERSGALTPEIHLGDLSVYAGKVGISVSYMCEYNMEVTLSPEAFEVQSVTAFGENQGSGNLAGSFSMNLMSVAEESQRFIMGSEMKVSIGWNARFLDDLSVSVVECTVSHGDVAIAVVKDKCFSSLLNAYPVETDDDHQAAFEFTVFKGHGQDSSEQQLVCTVALCKNFCNLPQSDDDCPVDDALKYIAV
jgi:hypothetical protein